MGTLGVVSCALGVIQGALEAQARAFGVLLCALGVYLVPINPYRRKGNL